MDNIRIEFLEHREWHKQRPDGLWWDEHGELMLIDNPSPEAAEAFKQYKAILKCERELGGDF